MSVLRYFRGLSSCVLLLVHSSLRTSTIIKLAAATLVPCAQFPDAMVVFRGNVLHNGLGYPAEHLRIHAYVYPPGYNHPSEVEFQQANPTGPTHCS